MGKLFICSLVALLSTTVAMAQNDVARLPLKTASNHPMQYYLSLPEGWTANKRWPVVVVIESANRQFQETTETFVKARQKLPFILVAPLVVTNGGANVRHIPTYHYSDAVWDQIDRGDRYRFDMEGIAAVIADVHKLYGGDDRYFLTGWEAGGHTTWALIFRHPESLRAAAPVCTNYLGRGVDDASFSTSPARAQLPIRGFVGAADPGWASDRPLYVQWEEAKRVAQAHGYRNVSQSVVAGKGHGPLPEEVLAFFDSVWKS